MMKLMTIKRKSAYYLLPVILVCVTALFVVKARYNNNQQDQLKEHRQSTSEDTKVVQENKQGQTEEHRKEIVADTIDESSETKEVNDETEVATPDMEMQDDTSKATFVENTVDKDDEESPAEVPNNEVGDSEARELPSLSDVHLRRPHYTKVLDNGTVFDSRNSREAIIPAGAVTSGSLDDLRNTIHKLEKIENKSPVLKAYIETLKRAENP